MMKSLKINFSDTQIKIMTGKSIQAKEWDDKSIMKAVVLKQKGGKGSLEFTRKHIAPLPSIRTVQQHFESLSFKAGILSDNIQVLHHQTSDFSPSQLRFGIYLDEKAIIPGESLDQSTGEYVGKVSLPPRDEHATSILVFLCCGVEYRLKMPVAFHFTGKSDTGDAQAIFLIELVKNIEGNSNIKIDFVVFDLGPTNVSMLKKLGMSLTKGNKAYWMSHPVDSIRKLYFIPDLEHCTKNVIAGLRNHNITIPQQFVEKFSLLSNTAKILDVENLCKSQEKFDFKGSKDLKDSIVNPDHFTKMRSHTFEALMAPAVVTSLELFDQMKRKRSNEKLNPTAFLLARVDQWHALTSQGQLNTNDDSYLKQKDFLIESVELISKMAIGNRHNICQTGSVWGTLALLELSEFWISIGMPFVKPSYLLNNCIENFFSLIASKQTKPSAVHATHDIKAISISKFFSDPVKGSYNWEETDEVAEQDDFSILTLLKGRKKIANSNLNVPTMSVVKVPAVVTLSDIFDHSFEHLTFYCFVCDILTSIFSNNQCEVCDMSSIDPENTKETHHKLQNLKVSKESPLYFAFSQEKTLLRPSILMENFFFQLEFIYSELHEEAKSPMIMKAEFLTEFCANDISFIHCKNLEEKIIESFISKRLKIVHELRLVHRKSRFASKSLQ